MNCSSVRKSGRPFADEDANDRMVGGESVKRST